MKKTLTYLAAAVALFLAACIPLAASAAKGEHGHAGGMIDTPTMVAVTSRSLAMAGAGAGIARLAFMLDLSTGITARPIFAALRRATGGTHALTIRA